MCSVPLVKLSAGLVAFSTSLYTKFVKKLAGSCLVAVTCCREPALAKELDLTITRGPFQPLQLCDSVWFMAQNHQCFCRALTLILWFSPLMHKRRALTDVFPPNVRTAFPDSKCVHWGNITGCMVIPLLVSDASYLTWEELYACWKLKIAKILGWGKETKWRWSCLKARLPSYWKDRKAAVLT